MKNLKIQISVWACLFALSGFWSCAEEEKVVLKSDQMIAPVLSATISNSAIVIDASTLSNDWQVAWSAASYGLDLAVNYTVQIDQSNGDFGGELTLGSTSETTLAVNLETLNNLLLTELLAEANEPTNVAIRVLAGVAGQVPQYSESITISVTPYEEDEPAVEPTPNYPKLWVAGDFQGWDIGNADTIVSKADDNIYEGYLYLPEGGTNEFKLYAQPDWTPDSYGSVEDSVITLANYAGGNLVAPSSGYKLLSVNLNDSSYFIMDTQWGIIGDATPNGWDADTDLAFDVATESWSVTTDMVAGSFKFRANDSWSLDFGIDSDGNLVYANHPAYAYVDQAAIAIEEDGNYTITLDLSDASNYRYSIVKN